MSTDPRITTALTTAMGLRFLHMRSCPSIKQSSPPCISLAATTSDASIVCVPFPPNLSSKNNTPLLLFLCTLSFTLASSRSFRLQLHTMPPFDLILQHGIDESMLFDDGQALEFRAHNIQSVHTTATAADVLDLHNIQSVTLRPERGSRD